MRSDVSDAGWLHYDAANYYMREVSAFPVKLSALENPRSESSGGIHVSVVFNETPPFFQDDQCQGDQAT
ncbi:MAG TPA: hypothetical protein VMW70_02850 [Burkholderiales bacterium]|nr:hypothetical protein [Burkholderiales bacterium]